MRIRGEKKEQGKEMPPIVRMMFPSANTNDVAENINILTAAGTITTLLLLYS